MDAISIEDVIGKYIIVERQGKQAICKICKAENSENAIVLVDVKENLGLAITVYALIDQALFSSYELAENVLLGII